MGEGDPAGRDDEGHDKVSVLFVCTHNSARSQMAEGLLRSRYPGLEALSAGTERTRVNPLAVEAMSEIGVDISGHYSKTVDDVLAVVDEVDYVVTVCDSARENCPYTSARLKNMHISFPDPSGAVGSRDERLAVFRRVRDGIASWIDEEFGRPG